MPSSVRLTVVAEEIEAPVDFFRRRFSRGASAAPTCSHAAIVFALEPVFASILAAHFLQEPLGPRGFAGGALVLAGIFVSELRLRRAERDIGEQR